LSSTIALEGVYIMILGRRNKMGKGRTGAGSILRCDGYELMISNEGGFCANELSYDTPNVEYGGCVQENIRLVYCCA